MKKGITFEIGTLLGLIVNAICVLTMWKWPEVAKMLVGVQTGLWIVLQLYAFEMTE